MCYNPPMYIPFEKINNIIKKFIDNEQINKFFYRKKILQNINYIKINQKKVIKKLQNKLKKGIPLNVVFYVYDESKWKCESLYRLLDKDYRFNVKILVTRNAVTNIDNPSYQTINDIQKCYNLFNERGLNVKLAYDINKEKHIPLENFNPDVIIYQHPWYVETTQGPVICSKFALTYYVPYYFPTTTHPQDYYLRFHQYIEKYCVFDEITKNIYKEKMSNKAKNVIVTGQPFLDYFKNVNIQTKEYIIYAPHWTICNQGISYGTFEWNGLFLLNYAKNHPEQKWVFKPHPLLKKALIDKNIMTCKETEEYYKAWSEIGLLYEKGDYLELFSKSKMLITDCSSFLGEYFMTGNPVVHLISKTALPYNETISQIIKYYYKAFDIESLKNLLEILPANDAMKQERKKAIDTLEYKKYSASEKILNDILSVLVKT